MHEGASHITTLQYCLCGRLHPWETRLRGPPGEGLNPCYEIGVRESKIVGHG